MPTSLPRIAVIGTGGTISSLGASSLDVLDYPDFGQKLTCEALLDRFPETRLVAEPVPVTFRQVGSTAIGPADWLELRALIHRTGGRGPSHRRVRHPARHGDAGRDRVFSEPDARRRATGGVGRGAAPGERARHRCRDQPRQCAAGRRPADARGKGVLVVLNNEIHPARDVVKTSTYRVQTFRSIDFGALGPCRRRRRAFLSRAVAGAHARHAVRPPRDVAPLPRVDIIYSYAGADGDLVEAAVGRGARSRLGRLRSRQPQPIAAGRLRRRGESGGCRRAVQPRHRPRRAAPPIARDRHRRRRGFFAAKGPHPARADAARDRRHRPDPGGVPALLRKPATHRRSSLGGSASAVPGADARRSLWIPARAGMTIRCASIPL